MASYVQYAQNKEGAYLHVGQFAGKEANRIALDTKPRQTSRQLYNRLRNFTNLIVVHLQHGQQLEQQ